MLPVSLLTVFLLALSVAANPIAGEGTSVRMPLSRRVNYARSTNNIAQSDQARAEALIAKALAVVEGLLGLIGDILGDGASSSSIDNQAVSYVATVGVGSPPTDYNLIVDTGSSNIWVGAGTAYKETSTSSKTSQSVAVSYGSGSFSGTEFIDQVTISSNLVIPKQSIGVASTSTGFPGVDGIIGVGPTDLTLATLSPDTNSEIPTVTDNLFSDGTIPAHQIGVSFEPISTSTANDVNGEISWGGIDSSKFTGLITFTPITSTSPANQFWGIDAAAVYGTQLILSPTAGIVDTGTTLVLIASNAFDTYQSLTGGVADANTGLLTITSAQYAILKSLFFTVNGVPFELTPNAQIWPRALNADIGGVAGQIYLIVSNLGTPSGQGLDFILGMAFLERHYSVFDTANHRVGLATTSFTDATTN